MGPFRTVLITGAGSGIGRELARWFAAHESRVYGIVRRAPDELVKELGAERIVPVQADVADADALVARIRSLDEEVGGFDLVIANAGIVVSDLEQRLGWEVNRPLIDVNAKGAAATLYAVADRMAARRRGHLVGISSLHSVRGFPFGAYSATKAFLDTLLETLRIELQPYGVHVTCVRPGYVRTQITANVPGPMMAAKEAAERIAQAIDARARLVKFPYRMALNTRILEAMPAEMFERAAGKMREPVSLPLKA